MSELEKILTHAEKCCQSRGKQLTSKRKLVLQAMVHANKALSAYELVDYCEKHLSESIQAMSVYRILDFLEEQSFVHKLNVSNKFIVCSHILCSHEHGVPQFFICSKCNKISEQIVDPRMVTGMKTHAKQEGFTVISPQVEISCVCDECAKKT
jgi:Fur family zinc uptake transcriptional regulator